MTTTDRLHALLARRILLLDGAMGTMIQRRTLGEQDFRGERFRGHARDLKGNGDVRGAEFLGESLRRDGGERRRREDSAKKHPASRLTKERHDKDAPCGR